MKIEKLLDIEKLIKSERNYYTELKYIRSEIRYEFRF